MNREKSKARDHCPLWNRKHQTLWRDLTDSCEIAHTRNSKTLVREMKPKLWKNLFTDHMMQYC